MMDLRQEFLRQLYAAIEAKLVELHNTGIAIERMRLEQHANDPWTTKLLVDGRVIGTFRLDWGDDWNARR